MNILYINEDNYGGGASKALIIYTREMTVRGHHVFIVTRKNDGYVVHELKKYDAKVFLCDIQLFFVPINRNPLKWLIRYILILFKRRKISKLIDKIICEEKIDVVHGNSGLLFNAYTACKKRNIPHILHHREFFDRFLGEMQPFPCRKYFFNLINSPFNYNICITRGIMNYLCLVESDKNRIIYDGIIDRTHIYRTNILKEKYFLFAGRVERNKATDVLLRVFVNLHRIYPEYKLKIAGIYYTDDPYYKECQNIVVNGGLTSIVEFLGFRHDLDDLMNKATAIVVPSVFEGFGYIMVEGMLNNTLIIGNNTTGTKEQFDIGLKQTGHEIGIRFSTEQELLDAMIYAIENDTTEMREDAYNVVIRNYTVERCVTETENFYRFAIEDYKKKIIATKVRK